MKRFVNGGSIDDDIRSRAMKSVEGLEGIKGSDIEDETGMTKGSIKRNEYGDLYDSEMKATPKAKAKEKSFTGKAKEAGFTSAETKGGAALMTRKDRSDMPKAVAKTTPKAAPKAAPKKTAKYDEDISYSSIIGAKKGGLMGSASSRGDGCGSW